MTSQGAYLAKEGEAVLVRIEEENKMRIPLVALESISCFGRVSMSPFLMGHCSEKDISVSFHTKNGRFLARVVGPTSGNVLLRRAQYRLADESSEAALIARYMLIGKVANSRTVLKRHLRDHADASGRQQVQEAAQKLARILERLQEPLELETARGLEGDAARVYFKAFEHLSSVKQEAFRFKKRSRRPPLDPINALLSFCYTLLFHDVRSACESVGLDPQVGFLHRDRPGRPSLALDLVEELRSVLADRLTLSLINRLQITPDEFQTSETGKVTMSDEARKTLLTGYQERKADQITHPYLQEKITLGLLPHIQARLLAKYIRGELMAYPPFFWK